MGLGGEADSWSRADGQKKTPGSDPGACNDKLLAQCSLKSLSLQPPIQDSDFLCQKPDLLVQVEYR